MARAQRNALLLILHENKNQMYYPTMLKSEEGVVYSSQTLLQATKRRRKLGGVGNHNPSSQFSQCKIPE